jgi:hypothetical protein
MSWRNQAITSPWASFETASLACFEGCFQLPELCLRPFALGRKNRDPLLATGPGSCRPT